jgi:hypothetical protein
MLLTSVAYDTSDVLRACQAASVYTVVRALLAVSKSLASLDATNQQQAFAQW